MPFLSLNICNPPIHLFLVLYISLLSKNLMTHDLPVLNLNCLSGITPSFSKCFVHCFLMNFLHMLHTMLVNDTNLFVSIFVNWHYISSFPFFRDFSCFQRIPSYIINWLTHFLSKLFPDVAILIHQMVNRFPYIISIYPDFLHLIISLLSL